MAGIKWNISPIALLLAALWYFFDNEGFFALLLPALMVHELGHAVFLRLGGAEIKSLSFGLFGFEMDYSGCLEGLKGYAALAAGPVFGFIYGILCQNFKSEFLNLSGGLSTALSLFNLLPVMPLDGGRILLMAAGNTGIYISRGIAFLLLAVAGALWFVKGWFSLFFMACWLVWCNFKNTYV